MSRPSRESKRIDYKILSTTGRRVQKSSFSSSESSDQFNDCYRSPISLENSPTKPQVEDPDITELSCRLLSDLTILQSEGSISFQNSHHLPSITLSPDSSYHALERISKSTPVFNSIDNQREYSEESELTNCPELQILEIFSAVSYWVKGLSLLFNEQFIKDHIQGLYFKMSSSGNAVLAANQEALGQDIDDFLEENPLEECFSVDEIDTSLKRIEELRTSYRMKHNEYKNTSGDLYDDLIANEFQKRLNGIKSYILEGKKKRKISVGAENAGVVAARSKSCTFYSNEIQKLYNELEIEFDFVGKVFTDDEILKRKQEIPSCVKRLEQITKLVKDLHESNKDGSLSSQIDQVMLQYDKICAFKNNYITFINNEEMIREISKKELFNEGKLRIQLSKFNGHESKLDIYV